MFFQIMMIFHQNTKMFYILNFLPFYFWSKRVYVLTKNDHKNQIVILNKIQLADYQISINKFWKKGIGESIAFGMREIMQKGNYEGLIISVADQPFLTADILKKLEKKIIDRKIIIKSKYEKGSGPPVYFSKHFFEEIMKLTGDEGAKKLIKKYGDKVVHIDFFKGNIDVDREEDLEMYWS